jgi:thiol:disulfide interchange protein
MAKWLHPNPTRPSRTAALMAFALLLILCSGHTCLGADNAVSGKLLVDRTPLVAGQDATLAVQVDVADGYHAQGAKPYDKYLVPTSVKFSAADGITADAPRYPVAKDIPTPEGLSDTTKMAVYEGRIFILIPIHIDAAATPGPRDLTVTLKSQACNEQSCNPPTTTPLKLTVEVAAPGAASTPQEKEAFDAARKQDMMPAPATAPPATTTAPAPPPPLVTASIQNEVDIILSRAYHAANRQDDSYSVLGLMLLALAGGAILNIMPCVLPVIPLKILTLVQQAHGNRAAALAHSLVFSAGVITLFVALAAALGSYQLVTGSHVIYGEQYSHPVFIITTALIVLALALSMIGVWTINPPRQVLEMAQRTGPGPQAAGALDDAGHGTGRRGAYMGSFMTGVLATVLATPCSAPLLGPVLFWALVRPLPVTMLAFALVGVGMSIPYVILAAFPAGLNRLPKAGRWTELLKQGLGIVMVGVALYLITRIPDTKAWPWALAAALVVSAVCWAWGQIPTPLMEVSRIWSIRITVVILGAIAGFGVYKMATPAPATGTQWQPFSLATLDKELAAGHPVVVDWTADWCINCRVVEATVLESPPVRAAFEDRHVVLLRADLTAENPPAKELLGKLGGGSIPFLAIFSPAHPLTPAILQDIYSRQHVVDEVNAAATARP